MSEIRSHLKILLASISAFSNDGKLDAAELRAMATIAENDGQIDTDEARVLRNIVDKLTDSELTPEMKTMVADLHAKLPSAA